MRASQLSMTFMSEVERLPGWIQFITWPIIFLISIVTILIALPEMIYHVCVPQDWEPDIKNLTRTELIDWSIELTGRFENMLELNDNADDVLLPPTIAVRKLQTLLMDQNSTTELIVAAACRTKNEFMDWSGFPLANLVWLCLHIERWAENET